MNILVTGAAGQLGKTLAYVAQGSGNTYMYCDSDELDITDAQAVEAYVADNGIDVIVNCASYTAVDKAEEEPETADLVNHVAVAEMARIAKEHDVVLIHVSTDYVFDGKTYKAYADDTPAAPLNVYNHTTLSFFAKLHLQKLQGIFLHCNIFKSMVHLIALTSGITINTAMTAPAINIHAV